MTNKQANAKALKLFNKWRKEFCNQSITADDKYIKSLEAFKNECLTLHYVVGVYEILSDKNALKMASICSTIRFVEPYYMLMKLQHTTKSY